MVLQIGSRVSFPADQLPGPIQAALAQQRNIVNIEAIEVHGTIIKRLPSPARGWQVAVDGGHGNINLSTRRLNELEDAPARTVRPRNVVNYNEDGYATEPDEEDLESESEASDADEEDHACADQSMPRGASSSRNAPTRHGPLTVENAKIEDWVMVGGGITTDERKEDVRKGRLLGEAQDELSHAQMFFRFFPLNSIEPLLPKWQQISKEKASPLSGMPNINKALFVGWIALWVQMMVVNLPSRKMYWEKSRVMHFPLFHEWGSWRYFEELLSIFHLPEYQPGDTEYLPDDPLQSVRKWYNILAEYWRENYKAGSIIVVDETMVFWTGQGVHLTYLPRKPTPVGVMLKTICDASSRVLLGWEFCEGKEADRKKRWCNQYGAGTACTLRLTLPWHGSSRIVIGDSWFGSLKCCVALLEKGLYSIMNVKTAHAAFPKQLCLAALKARGDKVWYHLKLQVEGEQRTVFAGGHMDKAPLVVVASCATSLHGGTKLRYRSKLVEGQMRRVCYQLDQPQMHALYRNNFNAVDVMNRLSQGPGCLSKAWATYNALHRLFAASLSACVTNAYQAWLQVHGLTSADYPQTNFKLDLAESLFVMMRELRAGRPSQRRTQEADEASEAPGDSLGLFEVFNEHVPINSQKRLMCDICKKNQTKLMCQKCDTYMCNPATGRQCMVVHMAHGVAGTAQGAGKRKRSNEGM